MTPFGRGLYPSHAHVRFRGQRVEIIEVGDAREAQHRDIDAGPCCGGIGRTCFQRDRIFLRDLVSWEPGDDAGGGNAGQSLEVIDSRCQQRCVAAEFVQDEAADQRALLGCQERPGAVEVREDSTAVDVACEQDRRVRVQRDRHVHDIAVTQIRLRRAAGSLDDNEVVLGAQAVECSGDDGPGLLATMSIVAVVQRGEWVPHHDHL